ncbi:hypothetical protein FB007_12032 [Sinorhizobium medicae]|nr:hypothetical protein FB007_12032 [Sinorhizobium medicae]
MGARGNQSLALLALGEPERITTRASGAVGRDGHYATRVPPGHPEGWIEGFAQIYSDAAEVIAAHNERRAPDPGACLLPTVHDGIDGMRFILASVQSHQTGRWLRTEGRALTTCPPALSEAAKLGRFLLEQVGHLLKRHMRNAEMNRAFEKARR